MSLHEGFRMGRWEVRPERNRLVGPDGERQVNSRSMDALLCLAERAGEVVSRDDFNREVWRDTVVTEDALTWSISELRRKLGDSATDPQFIETIPKRGYRLIAPVEPLESLSHSESSGTEGRSPWRRWWPTIPLLLLAVTLVWLALDGGPVEPAAEGPEGIAVLPFSKIRDHDGLPLAEGMHQDLLNRLSESPDLRVISATSMRRYRETELSIPEIASELDVEWIVEGAVQQFEERFRVSVRLIEAASETNRWARSYEDELMAEGLFKVQSEIVSDVARSIQAALSPRPGRRHAPTDNLDAYALHVQATTLLRQRSESAMRRAAELFKQATALDDHYAAAWAGHARARFLLHYYGHESDERLLIEARRLAETALGIDPELPDALVVKGLVAMRLDQDLPAALALMRRARAATPDSAVGWLAWLEAVAGNLQLGLKLTQEQIRTTPFSPAVHMSLSVLALSAGETDEALTLAERAIELSPAYAAAWRVRGQALFLQGRFEAAIESFQEAIAQADPEALELDLAWLALAQSRDGTPDPRLIEAVLNGDDLLARALVQMNAGEFDTALDSLRRVHWDDMATLMVRYHPIFEPLRDHPAYPALIARLDRWWQLES